MPYVKEEELSDENISDIIKKKQIKIYQIIIKNYHMISRYYQIILKNYQMMIKSHQII